MVPLLTDITGTDTTNVLDNGHGKSDERKEKERERIENKLSRRSIFLKWRMSWKIGTIATTSIY